MQKLGKMLVALIGLMMIIGLGNVWGASKDTVTVAYIANGPYTFWTYAHAGAIKAEEEFGIKVYFYKPPGALVEEQKRFIETMMAKGVDALAISVIDPENMTPFLNEIASQIPLVTFDSDAPTSKRRAYVGMSNYAAGEWAVRQLKASFPTVVIWSFLSAVSMRKMRSNDVRESLMN
jgi:ribose transport system substrate-binding protein